ncbi:MAG: hypothetical protein EAX90_03430 [Candidatus Heimdallarchaeota archaeon]|nr:hypothetical protein [Candidatus Heimdallarchaeota archaeon]
MTFEEFLGGIIPGLSAFWNTLIFVSAAWLLILVIVIVILLVTSKRNKGVDVSALAALASSDQMIEDTAPNANPKEVMTILQIERVAASTALSAVKDARRTKRISSGVSDSLSNRYQARIAKIDVDIKRRSGAQEYKSLAESLEQSRDKLRGEISPVSPTSPPPPPTSGTPGIPPTAPPVPGIPSAGPPSATTGIPKIPSLPSMGPPSSGAPPSTPSSPIPTPPKIPTVSPTSKPTTVVPPSVAPPTISSPPLPPKLPSSAPSVAPPTTSDMAPPPVPTSVPTVSAPTAPTASGDSDTQSISGLRMEMLRELARLKKFMSEETQD